MEPSDPPVPKTIPEYQMSPLETDDIFRFLSEKWVQKSCERCNVEKWGVKEGKEKYSVISMIEDSGEITTNSEVGLVVVNVFCVNCGNVRFTATSIIRDWLEKSPK